MNYQENGQSILNWANLKVKDLSSEHIKDLGLDLYFRNSRWRSEECFNFLAAESAQSKLSLSALGSDLGTRAASGNIGADNRFVKGTKYIDRIESLFHEMMKSLLSCKYVEYRPLGGVSACHIVYASLLHPGDIVMSLPEGYGGDPVHREDGAPRVMRLKVEDIPFNEDRYEIDLEELERKVKIKRPRAISIGQSNCLFPVDFQKIKSFIKDMNCILIADMAHQTGLICSKQFPNPLEYGGDILIGTTGKTFSGPHGGLIAWNNSEWSEKIIYNTSPVYTGTHQVNRIFSSLIAACEVKNFGEDFSKRTIENARMFGRILHKNGVEVIGSDRGFTDTHQILFKPPVQRSSLDFSEELEQVNLIVNSTTLPSKRNKSENGIRLGFTEVTRLGADNNCLNVLAGLFLDCLLSRRSLSLIREDVISLRRIFKEYKYCYEERSVNGNCQFT